MFMIRKNWVYIVSFLLGGITIFSDPLIIILAFGGWILILALLVGAIGYWLFRIIELIRFGICEHNSVLRKLTICLFIAIILGPIITSFTADNFFRHFGNKLIVRIEKYKETNESYPESLSLIENLPFSESIYEYEFNAENQSFYLSYKSRALVTKYYDYQSKKWCQQAR